MQKRVLETLSQFKDDQFFSLFEAEKDSETKDDKKDDKSDDNDDSSDWQKGNGGPNKKAQKTETKTSELDKESDLIIKKMSENFKTFMLSAKDTDDDILTPFLANLKKANAGSIRQYKMYDSPFNVAIQKGKNGPEIAIYKGNNIIYKELVSGEITKAFSDFLSNIISNGGSLLKDRASMKRKAKLAAFLNEDMNVDEYLNIYYDGIMEALENMGYTNEEADFIMGEAHNSGIAEDLASRRIDAEEAAKKIATKAIHGLKESKKSKKFNRLNEGLDPAIINYLIGTIGVFASAGLLAKFQVALAKNKNPKVQAFAKALSALGKSASSGIKGGTTSLGEGFLVKEQLNEDAGAIAALVPYIAGTLGTFIAAYGLDAIQNALAKSKNKKLRIFGKHLAKIGSTASKSIIGGSTSQNESVQINEGLDPQILTYLIGIIGVFASAGLLGKLQEYLGKHKNKKVQAFAKMLGNVGSTASKSIIGGTTSLKESVINEDAGAIMAILPHVAGVLAIFLTAFGIEPLKKAMKNSKNKKLRNLASGLEKAGSAATGSREKVNL